VPFTLSHAAAALPFRRLRLIPSALVVGTLAPDFEYFLRIAAKGGFGHTLRGAFVLTLPLALAVLWIFHSTIKVPLARLFPDGLERRVLAYLGRFRFFGPQRFAVVVASLLLGIATHLLWDAFTHPRAWIYRHSLFLSRTVNLPALGAIPCYKVLQYVSTVVGLVVLLAWFVRWYEAAEPVGERSGRFLAPAQRHAIVALMATVAFLGGGMRALAAVGLPANASSMEEFMTEACVTSIALGWWQLVAFGLLSSQAELRSADTR
jgi:hypothetical protein